MKRRVCFALLFLGVLFSGQLSAQELIDLRIPSARAAAMGGTHAALSDDLNTLFSNPAGFQGAESELSVAEITVGLSGPIFDIASVVVEASQTDISTVLTSPEVQSLLNGLYASMNLLGPISFGYVGRGLGFGIFNTTVLPFVNSKPLTITATVSERLSLSGGYAFRIPFAEESKHNLDIGLLLKGFLEGQVELEKSFLQLPEIFESISLATITGEPFHFLTGIGFDLGVQYSFNDVIHAGLTGIDVFTPVLINSYTDVNAFLNGTEQPAASNALYPVKVNAGVMFKPKLNNIRVISGLKFLLDYNDIFDFLLHPSSARNPLLHIGAGIELEPLEILSIRAGFNEGLFSGGVGMDLTFFTLNAAMFGSELSSEPGLRPVYNILIGLEFRFDNI
jgi:hypothetical protein